MNDLNPLKDSIRKVARHLQVFEEMQPAKAAHNGEYWNAFLPEFGEDVRQLLAALNAQGCSDTKSDAPDLAEIEEDRRKGERRIREILDSITESYFALDRDFRFTEINSNALIYLEKDLDDLLGQVIWDVYPALKGSDLDDNYGRVLETGEPAHFELESSTVPRWADVHVYPTDEGLAVYFSDITQRKIANQALRESYERLENVLNSITEAYFALDRKWRMLDFNQVAQREFLKRPREELIGKVFWELYPNAVGNLYWHNYHKAFETNQPVHFEALSGLVPMWYEVHAYPRGDRLDIYLHNIDERKKLEQDLAYQAQILENVHDVIIAMDTEQRIIYWNRAAEDLYGWTSEEAVGRSPVELMATETSQEQRKAWAIELQKNGRLQVESVQRTKDGRLIFVEGVSVPWKDSDGNIVGFINTGHEITERKRAEEERERLLQQVQRERDRAEQKAEELEAVIYSMADHVAIYDSEGAGILFNPTALKFIGLDSQDALDEDRTSFIQKLLIRYPDGKFLNPEMYPSSRALKGHVVHNQPLLLRNTAGEDRTMLVSAAPVIVNGVRTGAVVVSRDITDQRQTERDLLESRAQVEVQHRLIHQRELERLEIARDLHDGPLQDFIATQVNMGEALQITDEEARLTRMHVLREFLQHGIEELRAFCNELRPPVLAPFGLERAIRSHMHNFQSRYPGLEVEMDLTPDHQALPEDIRMALFRIYQELLNNVAKHAKAKEVRVIFHLDDQQAVLKVQDDGRGFQLPGQWLDLAREGHLGLVGIRERTEAIGGELFILTAPGNGTTARVRVPRTETPAQPELR